MSGRAVVSPAADEAQVLRIVEIIQAAARPEPTRIPKLISCGSLAARLDVSSSWVRVWHASGALRGFVLKEKPGGRGRLLFFESDVAAFLEARGIGAPADEQA